MGSSMAAAGGRDDPAALARAGRKNAVVAHLMGPWRPGIELACPSHRTSRVRESWVARIAKVMNPQDDEE
jgi:hypothetical protein